MVTINFSQPVVCVATVGSDWTMTDNNASTTDPTFTALPDATNNKCGTTQQTAGTPLVLDTNIPLPAATTYTLTYNGPAGDVKNVYNVNLAVGSTVTFTTGAADFTPPTMIDARMANNVLSTDFRDISDSFTVTFSEKMNGGQTGTIGIQDQDGTTATIQCFAAGPNVANAATCSWDSASTTVLTVTLSGALTNSSGTTPGMQIPFNITSFTGVADVAGNPPNVLGSSDRLVDYE
jgi:hypothetical protein